MQADGSDPARCPLCGEPNACALAAGRSVERCWCVDRSFPEALLRRVPEEARGRACICRGCLDRFAGRVPAAR